MNEEDGEKNDQIQPDNEKPKRGRRPKTHSFNLNLEPAESNEITDDQKENTNETGFKRRKVSFRIIPRKEESEDHERKERKIKQKKIKQKIEEPRKIVSRKERILHFLNKDQFQVLYPEIRPFKNKKHAIECLLPYHLFSEYEEEDVLEYESNIDTNSLLDRIKNAFVKSSNKDSIVVDILKLEEAKYYLSKMESQKESMKMSIGKIRMKIYNKGSIRIRMNVDEEMLKDSLINKI